MASGSRVKDIDMPIRLSKSFQGDQVCDGFVVFLGKVRIVESALEKLFAKDLMNRLHLKVLQLCHVKFSCSLVI